jgi:hypothetical protein
MSRTLARTSNAAFRHTEHLTCSPLPSVLGYGVLCLAQRLVLALPPAVEKLVSRRIDLHAVVDVNLVEANANASTSTPG